MEKMIFNLSNCVHQEVALRNVLILLIDKCQHTNYQLIHSNNFCRLYKMLCKWLKICIFRQRRYGQKSSNGLI